MKNKLISSYLQAGKSEAPSPNDGHHKGKIPDEFTKCYYCNIETDSVQNFYGKKACNTCMARYHRYNGVDVNANAERRKFRFLYGALNEKSICPHCQEKGTVYMKNIEKKTGISGTKLAGAFLTLGWSLLLTGLSERTRITEAHCVYCNSTWHF